MANAVPIVTVDLSQCRTKEGLEQGGRYGMQSYMVIERDNPEDVYRALSIDNNLFNIFVKAELPTRLFSGVNRNAVFEFSTDMNIYLYVEKKTESGQNSRYYSEPNPSIHLSIPNGICKAEKITFHQSANTSYGRYIFTLTFSIGDAGPRVYNISCPPNIAETAFGLSFSERGIACLGSLFDVKVPNYFYQSYDGKTPDFTLKSLMTLQGYVKQEANIQQLMRELKQRDGMTGIGILAHSGNKKVLDQMLPFYEELLGQDEPILLATFQTIVSECKRTINGVKVAKFFNDFFSPVREIEAFKAKLLQIYLIYIEYESAQSGYRYYRFEEVFIKFPGYTELRKQALRSQSGRALNKMVTDIEALQFDETKYPILAALIHDGSIPVSTFFRKEGDETYFLFNNNWDLFEQFLAKHREAAIKLAQLASQRTTYEKSLMSYMYFILYDLPEYLEKHTGKSWTCFPSIVESAHELEPGPTKPGQTTKKRSALTPIVDNEACTVVVPYACLKISGITTTYTYSLNYSLIRRGLSIDGAVALNDIEEKLNGCDDYGLMFYTLTGSAAGRGYPTFLIIFERLGGTTRVHFHRTHPLRSKDGDNNPLNNWIRTCYNWMVGNINMTDIKVQQGDLVFISVDSLPAGERVVVDSYDSHTFEKPVSFIPCTKKDAQNILGYFDITEDVTLSHVEHRQRQIPAGYYQLRQCRSWEANPKGIWTLRID